MNSLLKNSVFIKLAGILFINNKTDLFKDSRILKFLSFTNHQNLSIGFLSLSLVCFCYENWFSSIGVSAVSSLNLATIFLLLSLIFCDKTKLKSTKQVIYLMFFAVILFVSGLFAAINGLELGMIFLGLLLFCQFIFAYLISSTYKNKDLTVNLILILSLPLLTVGLYQIFFGEETSKLWVSVSENLISNRIFGFFGSPNVFAGVLMLTSIMSLFRLFESKKWRYLAYLIIDLVLLIYTFSRSAWISLILGISVSLIIKNWRYILITSVGLTLLIFPSVRQRLFVAVSREYFVDAALDGRIWATNNAFEIFKNSPIIGTGPGSYGGQMAIYYNSPIYLDGMQNGYIALAYTDNQWAQLLVQTGFLGILSIAGFFVSHLLNSLRQYLRTRNYLSLGIVSATVAIIIYGMFGNILEFGAVSVLAGIYLGLGNSYE